MFFLKVIPFTKKKIKNQLWYMFLNLTFYKIKVKNLQKPYKLPGGQNVVSCSNIINIQYYTVIITNLSQFLLGKYSILNPLLILLFSTLKSLECSTDRKMPPIFFSFFLVDYPSQVASIHMYFIYIGYLPFSTFGCLSQRRSVKSKI